MRVAVSSRHLDAHDLGDHLDRLYRAAYVLCGNRHDAEDLVQETYARLLRKPRRLRNADALGYLLTALRNTYINEFRSTARRPRSVDLDETAELAARDPQTAPHEAARANEVLSYLHGLPPDLGQAIMAVDVVGLTPAEAADSLGVDRRALEHSLRRARISVARQLAPQAAGPKAAER